MPTDRQAQERRRQMILAILEVEPSIGQQQELVERLAEMGIPATQSSISRDLKALGVVRVGDAYRIPRKSEEESWFKGLLGYVIDFRPAGPHMTLIKAFPGAGPLVARVVESSGWEEVVGTVAGHDSALVLTATAFDQKLLLARLKKHFDEELAP